MVEITLPIVLQIIQTVSLIMGITYYLFIMRNSQRTRELTLQSQELTRKAQEQALETRQAQFFMQIYDRFNNSEYWEQYAELRSHTWDDYEDWQTKYGMNNRKAYTAFTSMASYFDGLGVLVDRGLIDVGLVDDLLHTRVLWFWDTWGDIIRKSRVEWNTSRIWPYIDSLYSQIQDYENQT